MKLGIDISQIIYKGSGVARFTDGLLKSILDFDRKNSWFFFFSSLRRNVDHSLEKKIDDKGHMLIKWKLPATALSLLFNDLHSFSKYLASSFYLPTSLDWLITSDWVEPSLKIKKATIVHDLVYLRYPELVDKKILLTQRKRLNWVKKESEIIFTDSHATKQDLIELLKINRKKIVVNYPGVEIKKPTNQQIANTIKKYKLNKPFILTVGKLEPRKNIEILIEAFVKLNAKNMDLIIAGTRGWGENTSIKHLIEVKEKNIRFLGYIDDLDLYSLYSSCLFFIYPSIWEGFGYPVVEAMKLGVPVATSNTSSLKEIVHDAGLLFNPHNVDEIYLCINTMLKNAKLRADLAKKGYEKSKLFIWKTYYNKLIQTLYDHRG